MPLFVEIRQRNKLIKISDRHGWDTIREYTLHPLADDNEDASKLRTAIARVSRKRNVSKPYDRKPPTQPNQGYGGFAVVKTLFFVQKSNQKTIQPHYLHQVHIFSATCPETLQSIAYTTAASSQQGPQTTATTATSSANAGQPPNNNVVTNEVEYFNCSDYVLKQGSYVVKGNIRKHLQFWNNILCVTQYIAEIIEFGFKIPFIKVPSQIFCRNNLSTNFVENAIHELLDAGCIKESYARPHCVNALTVSVNSSGKGRLILDLRHVNSFVEKQKNKFEGCKQALNYAHKDDKILPKIWIFSYRNSRRVSKVSRFLLKLQRVYKVLCFCSITFLFELCWSCFHESVAPFSKALGSFGYQIIMYLDDGWASHDEYTCRLVSKKVQEDLKNADSS